MDNAAQDSIAPVRVPAQRCGEEACESFWRKNRVSLGPNISLTNGSASSAPRMSEGCPRKGEAWPAKC